jgi:hypothetical protein
VKRSKREAGAVTGVVAVLAASVALCAVVPGLEHALNVGATVLAVVVGAFYVFLIVRDLWL